MERNAVNEYSSCTQNDTSVVDCKDASSNAEDPTGSSDGPRTMHGALVERLSHYGRHILPSSFARRSRLQTQPEEVTDSITGFLHRCTAEAPERASLTPAMRKKYLKEFLWNNASNIGFGGVISTENTTSFREEQDNPRTDCVLNPMEHACMLSAFDGNYEAIFEFIADDPHLLTRKDFISGYSVLHWLAKSGHSETLAKLLKHAENVGIHVNINLRGSGGLTPLHVASMHSQYMVIKLLVGAFGAKVDTMDYNGRRAWQYLKENAPLEMQELLGTWDEEHNAESSQNSNNSACSPTIATNMDHEEVDSLNRNRRAGSWRIKPFTDLIQSLHFWGNRY